MTFIWPIMLGTLLLLPPLGWFYLRLERRRRSLAERNKGFGLTAGGVGPGWRRHIPPALFLIALALLCLALARPQARISLPRLEGRVILVFDVSGSMAADDMEPTRMEAAKAVATEFVRRQPATAQIGVVAFSDGGLAVQLPTSDEEAILASIGRLRPERGTSLGEGIRAALSMLASGAGQGGPQPDAAQPPAEAYSAAAIVLLSDGENNVQPDPLELALAAGELGVRIYTVGVGTTAGTTLELEGFSVHSQLEPEVLQQIADLSGGAYYSAEDSQALSGVYDEVAAQLVVRPEQTEITAALAGLSLALLLAGGLCSFLWFNRLA